MLQEGPMPLNEAEAAAIAALVTEHGANVKSFTRSQPGETGPLWVTVGEEEYEVAEDGATVKRDG